jgi:hypothetical protein
VLLVLLLVVFVVDGRIRWLVTTASGFDDCCSSFRLSFSILFVCLSYLFLISFIELVDESCDDDGGGGGMSVKLRPIPNDGDVVELLVVF